MMTFSQQPTKTPIPREATPLVRISRVRFTDETSSAGGRRRFTQPRHASALEEDVTIESVAAVGDRLEPIDHFFIVCVPEGSSNQNRERARALLASPERPGATRTITLEHGSDVLEWRPGLAVVHGRENSRDDVVAALVDFAFYEGNLRALEEAVEGAEVTAQADVALAHRMRYRDTAHLERLRGCAEHCSRMRLTFARLEPQLGVASRSLSAPARGWMSRLIQKADIESRLEALSDRLEALEDLYEGATQRISEHRWYVSGHALEIGIIVLLLFECTLMSADIYLHNRGRQDPQRGPAAALVRGG
jgi:hypothetical protein